MDKELLGKILIVISIIGFISTISISSFTLITLNDTYEKALPLFDKIDSMKIYVDNLDENLEEFSLYLNDIDTEIYKQKINEIKSFVNTLNSIGLGSLVSSFNDDLDQIQIVIDNIEDLKTNLNYAKTDFSTIQSSLQEYENIKGNLVSFIGTLRIYILCVMTYCIILNGILLYVGYYLLKLNRL